MTASPTLQKAIQRLRSRIAAGDFAPAGILPSVKSLAASEGISLVTMWKALQVLKQENILSGKRGTPLTINVGTDSLPQPLHTNAFPQPKLKWKHLCATMKRDLLSGVYRPGQSMPSVKELQNRYEVSYPTLHKALLCLMQEGIVQSSTTGYRAMPLESKKSSGSHVVLITRAETLAHHYSGVLFLEFLSRFEDACRVANIGLEIISYHMENGMPQFTSRTTGKIVLLRDQTDTLGFLYAPQSYWGEQEIIAQELAFATVPIAIFDDSGEWEYSSTLIAKRHIRFFRVGQSGHPAKTVARYLLSLHHHHAAYFSPFHAAHWSITRLAGIAASFEEAGHSTAVTAQTIDNLPAYYLDMAERGSEVTMLAERYKSWVQKVPVAYIRQFEPIMHRLFSVESAHAQIRMRMEPLFEEALKTPGIRVWIAASDLIAGFAMDFCTDKKIEVPGCISIISFDDSMEARTGNITSYNFNFPAVADAALSHLLQRRNALYSASQKIIDIEGSIALRGSTCRAVNPAAKP